MGEINIPREERSAVKAIETRELGALIDQALEEKRPSSLRVLQLESCGPYMASQLRAFERVLTDYGAAKSAKKLAETEYRARRAGGDLMHAVQQMKQRVEEEEKEHQLFYIDDLIMSPDRFSEHLTVRVSYRWRPSPEDSWQHGSIVFIHDVDVQPDYTRRPQKRDPSSKKQEQDRQERLYRDWDHLRRLGLHSLREFFRNGGSAASVPETFQARVDSYGRGLNNFSAQFWLVQS